MNGDFKPPKLPRRIDGMKRPSKPPVAQQKATTPILDTSVVEQLPQPFDMQNDDAPTPAKKTRVGKKRRIVSWILGFLVASGALTAGVVYWAYTANLAAVDPNSHQQVEVSLPPGTTTTKVAQILQQKGVIKNSQAFELYVKLKGVSGKLQAGAYRIAKSSDVPAVVAKLTTGKTDTFTITFLPGATLAKHRKVLLEAGYSVAQVDAALAKQYTHPLLASKPAEADLEGYIYGETYQMPSDATVSQVLERTFDEYYKTIRTNNLEAKFKERGFSIHQGIIMASIIQREVGKPEKDQAMVAGVFYNRLASGMNLGSDVTYQYIADKTGVQRDPGLQSPYNTRIHTGLTPGPIASPGKGALIAAANPSRHNYLFFLSGDDDVTYFGVTDADHQRNIRDHCHKKCQIL